MVGSIGSRYGIGTSEQIHTLFEVRKGQHVEVFMPKFLQFQDPQI